MTTNFKECLDLDHKAICGPASYPNKHDPKLSEGDASAKRAIPDEKLQNKN